MRTIGRGSKDSMPVDVPRKWLCLEIKLEWIKEQVTRGSQCLVT